MLVLDQVSLMEERSLIVRIYLQMAYPLKVPLKSMVLGVCALAFSLVMFVKGGPSSILAAIAKTGFTAAFTLIFVSEIGDKTFFIAALLAMQYKKGLEACQKKVEETSTQGIQKSPNELYWETVGGRNKKGRVKGLGQGAELYYDSQKGSKSSQQYTPSFLSQMQDQMDQRVEQRLEERVQAVRSGMEVEMETRLAEIERRNQERYEEMMRRFSRNDPYSNIPHQRRDPTNDPGSGGVGQGTPAVA